MGQQGKQAMNLACKLSIPNICNNEQENKKKKKNGHRQTNVRQHTVNTPVANRSDL